MKKIMLNSGSKKKTMNIVSVLCTAFILMVLSPISVSASDKYTGNYDILSKTYKIDPSRASLVIKNQPIIVFRKPATELGYKVVENTVGLTCCTNWNTATGGTGCASFSDSCPSDQFEVTCKGNGCF